jgi:EAL domain-containing protein (putative c-di-GMP-specific phosphodiesterase class I)
VEFEDYGVLARSLVPRRERGLRVAVDDVGAGYASLRHALQLAPDMVKMDISLTRGVDRDPGRRALAAALISFAAETNMTIVAEGIETVA